MMIRDLLTIVGSFGLALLLRAMLTAKPGLPRWQSTHLYTPAYGLYAAWFALAYLFVALRYGLYKSVFASGGLRDLRLVIQGCLSAGLLLLGVLSVLRVETETARTLVIALTATSSVLLCSQRGLWRMSRLREYEQGSEQRNVLVLGTNRLSVTLARYVQGHRQLGYRFVGFLAKANSPINVWIGSREVLGGLEQIRELTRQHFIDELVITESCSSEDVLQLMDEARGLDIDIRAFAGCCHDLATDTPLEFLGTYPMVALHRRLPNQAGSFFKRTMDIALSLTGLCLTLPLLLAIALAVKIDTPGPALYVSERIGKRGRAFRCFKFRTMMENADRIKQQLESMNERDGILFKCSNDPRVTRLGRFLRKYSLDEIPQLLNVLRGEMSLVGPRPSIASEVEQYQLEHLRRLEVLPGLTGLWQVEARHDPSFAKYIELDTEYVENWNIWLDVKILLRTATVVLQGTGV